MKTKPAYLKILRSFNKYDPANLVVFGGNVADNLDPTIFLNLVVAPKDLQALVDVLQTKERATLTGGTVATAERDSAFDAVTAALNANANVVETVVGNNMALLLSTGYLPASTNRSQSPLDDTAVVALLNNGTTQVLAQLLAVRNAKSYQVQSSTDGGKTWMEAGITTKTQRFVLTGLVPGTTYWVRARAIGGSTGASSWCSPMSIMST
jgi:hypothetical protein